MILHVILLLYILVITRSNATIARLCTNKCDNDHYPNYYSVSETIELCKNSSELAMNIISFASSHYNYYSNLCVASAQMYPSITPTAQCSSFQVHEWRNKNHTILQYYNQSVAANDYDPSRNYANLFQEPMLCPECHLNVWIVNGAATLLCCFLFVALKLFSKQSTMRITMIFLLSMVKSAYCENISCISGQYGCYNTNVTCLGNARCTVLCSGGGAPPDFLGSGCSDATINGGNASDLNVICDGYGACAHATINAGTGNLTVVGRNSSYNLLGANINCPDNAICNITCSMSLGCGSIKVHGAASTLYINVLGGDIYSVIMQYAHIYCPNDGLYGNTNNCNLFFENGENSRDMIIYAVEGLNDVNIHCTDDCSPETSYRRAVLKCTADFTSQCAISALPNQEKGDWACVDWTGMETASICSTYFIPTSHPSNAPSNSPSAAPTNAPSTSPIMTPYSSRNILYVRSKGCDDGNCSSSAGQFDYDSICQNQHMHQTNSCCKKYPQPPNSTYQPAIPPECKSDVRSITTISSNAVFSNSFVGYTRTESLCVTLAKDVICYNPVITVAFEPSDYKYDHQRFYIAYKNASNLLNDGCLGGEPHCSYPTSDAFLDCPVNTSFSEWFYTDTEPYKIFYFMNDASVSARCWTTESECYGCWHDMRVRLEVDCSDPVKPSTCKTLNYSWNCFHGNIADCGHYDSNGIIDIGEGTFELYDVIRSKFDQIQIHGAGMDNTFLNHSVNNNISLECHWQCFLTIKDLTFITSNHASFEIFHRANVRFSNVRFDGKHSSSNFHFDGEGTNVTFINCEFINYEAVYNLFRISNEAMISVTDTVFSGNSLITDMIVVDGGMVIFDAVQFSNNKGVGKGIIHLINSKDDYSFIEIRKSLFHHNQNLFSLIYQKGFSGTIAMNDNIFEHNININHLIAIYNVNSTISILQTHFADNNYCLETYCIELMDVNANIDQYSANIWTAAPTSTPTTAPTAAPTNPPTTAPTAAPTISTTAPPPFPSVDCGTNNIIGSILTANDTNYYSLRLDVFVSKLIITPCRSSSNPHIYFYSSNMTLIDGYQSSCICEYISSCIYRSILNIYDINPGFYTIGIGGYIAVGQSTGSYLFEMSCTTTTNHTLNTTLNPTINPTINPTLNATVSHTINPTPSPSHGSNFIGFGHSNNTTNYNSLRLINFEPETLLQNIGIDLIGFGVDNGTIIISPCRPFNNSDFNHSILFYDTSTNITHDRYYPLTQFQQLLTCNNTLNCYIECDGACVGSEIISNATYNTLIACSSMYSCLQTVIDITASTIVSILCEGESSCKQSVITATNIESITMECVAQYSCLETTIDIKNASQMEIRCYSQNACDSIHIYSDSDNITFKFYNYNKDVSIYVPTNFIIANLDCNPLNAYLSLDGAEFVSLNQSAMDVFGGTLPCDAITYYFTEIQKAPCEVRYHFTINYLPILNYLYDIISCFYPIWISEFTDYACYGTSAPTTDPTNAPTFSPTANPTRIPTLDNAYDLSFDITYLLEECRKEETHYLVSNVFNATKDITIVLEKAYFAATSSLAYKYFWLLIQKINNVKIGDIANNQNKNELEFFHDRKSIPIESQISCNKDACDTLLHVLDIDLFRNTAQEKLREYFSAKTNINSSIQFSIESSTEPQLLHPLEWYEPQFDELWEALVTILVAVILLFCLIGVIAYYFGAYRPRKLRAEQSKYIKNALVLLVAIADYDGEKRDAGDIEGYLPNLDGIEWDVEHMVDLFGRTLNYDIFPVPQDVAKTTWTQNELKRFLESNADYLEENISAGKKYDALILVISCHGIPGYLCTSDYKQFSREAAHRIFSLGHNKIREIPRFILYDCCSGADERETVETSVSASNSTHYEQHKCVASNTYTLPTTASVGGGYVQGKLVGISDIKSSQAWVHGQNNPDYMLARVEAANFGFQSKLDSRFGSFVVHRFYEKYMANLQEDAGKFLFEIFDEIQDELHAKGKQLPQYTWNNETRYIKFEKNNLDKKQINCDDAANEVGAGNNRIDLEMTGNKKTNNDNVEIDMGDDSPITPFEANEENTLNFNQVLSDTASVIGQ